MEPEGERSISSGISLPQWMKVKITERYDLEQTAFSPPTEDDGFFFMRYPSKAESRFPNSSGKSSNSINEVRRKISSSKGPVTEPDLDLNQHTTPCRQFILQNNVEPPIQVIQSGLNSRFKSAGVDDGFKTAACGKSVVEVANQMINLKLYNGRNSEELPSPDKTSYLKQRRNSKSLPASPASSPKIGRRNPFFSEAAFESVLDTHDNNASKSNGWISFSSLLNPRDAIEESAAVSREASERGSTLSIAENPESLSAALQKEGTSPKILRARPSELREMNFWSPTSM